MTEPSAARPVPGPAPQQPASGSRAVGAPTSGPPAPSTTALETAPETAAETGPGTGPGTAAGTPGDRRPGAATFADLPHRPVEEHVTVYEAEHARLQRELSTVDQY